MKYLPIHMHLHASHEPLSSIGGHMARAASLGIHHLWLTEHDVRMGTKKEAIEEFCLAGDALTVQMGKREAGFLAAPEGTGTCRAVKDGEGFALRVSAERGEWAEAAFFSAGKHHADPVFGRPTVTVDGDFENGEGVAELVFILSQQPPHFEQVRLCYRKGALPPDTDRVCYRPFPEKGERGYEFRLWEEVPEAIGGLDNAFCSFALRAEDGGSAVFRHAYFSRELEYEEARREQILLARALGRKWGVTPFVGFEITGAGQHKNCYSESVPVMEYRAANYRITQGEAIAHVQKHGGIFSYNHAFTRWKREELDDTGREAVLSLVAEELTENRVYGAAMLEVGFPRKKEGFPGSYYRRLWDMLALRGVFITGDGDSDSHTCAEEGWLRGNNFCTWVGVEDELTEESFRDAILHGRAYMGDPCRTGKIRFSAEGREMGSALWGDSAAVLFEAEDFPEGAYALRIVNGKEICRIPAEGGCMRDAFTLLCAEKYNFARMEIYAENGELIALTNPIYLVRHEEDLPPERRQI